jgi:hypothetical protein
VTSSSTRDRLGLSLTVIDSARVWCFTKSHFHDAVDLEPARGLEPRTSSLQERRSAGTGMSAAEPKSSPRQCFRRVGPEDKRGHIRSKSVASGGSVTAKKESRRPGSNRKPSLYKSDALPVELRRRSLASYRRSARVAHGTHGLPGRCSRCRARAVQDVKPLACRGERVVSTSKHRTAGWCPLCEALPTDRVSPIEQRQAGAGSPIPRAPELCRGLGRASETPRPDGRRGAARQASQPSRIAPGSAIGLSDIRRLRGARGALPGSVGSY